MFTPWYAALMNAISSSSVTASSAKWGKGQYFFSGKVILPSRSGRGLFHEFNAGDGSFQQPDEFFIGERLVRVDHDRALGERAEFGDRIRRTLVRS